MRHSAVCALGELRSKEALPALEERLDDPTALVRIAAAKALRSVADPEATAALHRVLDTDSDARVRLAAADSLVRLNDKAVLPRLGHVVDGLSWWMRADRRRRALKKIADEFNASVK